jgi:hypothetical protein
MTRYKKLLLGAILARLSTVLIVSLGLFLMPKDQNTLLMGIVYVILICIGGYQVRQIIDYLAMDEQELIDQVTWEQKQ